MTKLTKALTLGLILAPTFAHAHPGHVTTDWSHGFSHPMTGMDHLLAMLAVGLWAVQLGGRAIWKVPAAFVGVMALGSMLGMAGGAMPGVEQAILASVLILGVLVAAAVRLPVAASAAIVGVFALFHGYAHGTEMPMNASSVSYIGGFALATMLLHGVGIAAGLAAAKARESRWVQFAGGAIALSAVLMTIGWM